MRRRDFIGLLAGAPATVSLASTVAQPAVPRGTRSFLATLDPVTFTRCFVDEPGRAGAFAAIPRARLTPLQRAELAADRRQGLYVASTANPDFVLARVDGRVLTPEMFGAIGDGRANDDEALLSMAAVGRARGVLAMLGARGRTYAYTTSLWLTGLRRIDIDGGGCAFRNILGSDEPLRYDTINYVGLALPVASNTYAYNSRTSRTILGTLIETARAGSREIATRGDGPAVKPGDRVLVYGFDRQVNPSDPCCARYFEYHRAAAVAANVITLDAPLRYGYDAAWYDGVHGSNGGAPRVLSLDRADFTQIEHIRLANLTIEVNPAWTAPPSSRHTNGRLQVYGYDEAILDNVTCPAMYVGQGRRFRAENCTFPGQIEVDKLIERVHFKSCTLGEIGGWSSVLHSILEDCRVVAGPFVFGATELAEIKGGHLSDQGGYSGHVIIGTEIFATPLLIVDGARITVTDPARNRLLQPNTYTVPISRVVSPAIYELGTRAEFDAIALPRMLSLGLVLRTAESAPALKLTRLPYLVDGNVRVEGEPLRPLAAGDTLSACNIGTFIVRNTLIDGPFADRMRTFDADQPVPVRTELLPRAFDDRRSIGNWRVESSDFDPRDVYRREGFNFKPGRRVRLARMVVDVTKPYTGSAPRRILRIARYPYPRPDLALIDLRHAGRRIVRLGGGSGARGADRLLGVNRDREIQFRFFNEADPAPREDAAAEPRWTCRFEGVQE